MNGRQYGPSYASRRASMTPVQRMISDRQAKLGLALVYRNQGDEDSAVEMERQAAELEKKIGGRTH